MTRTTDLRLSPDLTLPLNFATEGVAVIGMRGSGKSSTQVRWCEVLYAAGVPFVAIDPKGDWYGIRSSADGKSAGLSVPVFGGLYADFPLEEHLGERIADLLVNENMSAVLDVSRLSIGARGRFLTAFFNRLIERHQSEPHVRCVVLEEAHRYIPQDVKGDSAKVKEAAASVLLEGRAWGLGCWAATQRPARLHKDVLEEVGTAIVFRLGVAATNDLKTVRKWVEHEDLGPEISASLTKLANGEGWMLAPSTLGVAKRVQFDRRTTYDTGATPIVGAAMRKTVTMADIDAGAIKEALDDAIEKAKATDPAELQKRLRESERHSRDLEAKLERALDLAPVPAEPVPVDVPVLDPEHLSELAELLTPAAGLLTLVHDLLAEHRPAAPRPVAATGQPRPRASAPSQSGTGVPPAEEGTVPATSDSAGGGGIKKGARRMVEALARYGPLRRDDVSVLAHVARGGTLSEYSRSILDAGYAIEIEGLLHVTTAGVALVGVEDEPFTTAELLATYNGDFKAGAQRMLDLLVDRYPEGYSRTDLSDLAQIARGGTLSEYSRSLLKRGVAVEADGVMYANPILFRGPRQ